MGEEEVWLSIGDVARVFGVHEGTVRRWADSGRLPSFRTPGGHRRFLRTEVMSFLASQRVSQQADDSRQLSSLVLAEAQKQLAPRVQKELWHAYYNDQQVHDRRQTGQKLLGLLIHYAARSGNGQAYLDDARQILREYSREAVELGLPLSQLTRAYLLYRHSLVDAILRCTHVPIVSDPDSDQLLERVNHFWDELLLAMIDGYLESKSTGDTVPVK